MTQKDLKIAIVMGTRPEIIKLAPVIRELEQQDINFDVIYTDQHYDYNLSRKFFDDLQLEEPKYHLKIGAGTQIEQIGKAIVGIEQIMLKNQSNLIIVQGDTNSSLSGALVALKMGIKLAHIEAGLRSYDYRMQEEHNRRIIDHISNYLFAPTENSVNILKAENVWGKIYNTGNTVIDACLEHLELAKRNSLILNQISFKNYALVTSHRAENVDDPNTLKNIVQALLEVPIPIVFPIHPRTLKRLKEFNLFDELKDSDKVLLLEPVGYFDFLTLMHQSDFIITDSGGIQEEATAPNISKFSFILRKTSDRPESVKMGFSKIVGTNRETIISEIKEYIEKPVILPLDSPYGDGKASKKIISIIKDQC